MSKLSEVSILCQECVQGVSEYCHSGGHEWHGGLNFYQIDVNWCQSGLRWCQCCVKSVPKVCQNIVSIMGMDAMLVYSSIKVMPTGVKVV